MTCDCAKEIDVLLNPKGERLSVAFDLKRETTYYVVKIEQIMGGRAKTTLMLANYCPFCGKAQETR